MCYLCEKGHVVMERLKIAFFSFLLFQETSTIPTRSTVNLLRVISFILIDEVF